MKRTLALKVTFMLLGILTVVAGLFLGQKSIKAINDDDPKTPHMRHEFMFLGGGWLGVSLEDVTAENMGRYRMNEEAGAIVKSVEKDSPAEKAGLQENDVVLSYAGTPVYSVAQLSRLVRETPADRSVSLGILRNGNQQTLQVKIAGHSGGAFKFEPQIRKMVEEATRATGKARIAGIMGGGWLGRPRLGVGLEDLTDQMAVYFGVKSGVLITSVADNSAGAKAGLRAGDVITGIDNKEIRDASDVIKILREKEEGGPLTLNIVRDKRPTSVTVTLEKAEKTGRTRTVTRARSMKL